MSETSSVAVIDWNDRVQVRAPAASARVVVRQTWEWLQGLAPTPATLFERRSMLTRVVHGLVVVMELHVAGTDGSCAACSHSGSVDWPCETWTAVAVTVHGLSPAVSR